MSTQTNITLSEIRTIILCEFPYLLKRSAIFIMMGRC